MNRLLFLPVLFLFSTQFLLGQCQESTFTVEITTDFYAYELSWVLKTTDGAVLEAVDLGADNIPNNETTSWDVCIETEECLVFTISDDYGDGINAPGGYRLLVDGLMLVDEGFIGSEETRTVNCAAAESCLSAVAVLEGTHTASFDDHWYSFIPPKSGQYLVTTCELTTCDSKIWIYESCNGFDTNEDNQGTIFYDDNFGGCGEQANVMAQFTEGLEYFIRIGDDNNSCAEDIDWSLSYLGAIMGCIDPNACNYNPAATEDDGSCIYPGDPECPDAPDLVLRQDKLKSSVYLTTIDNSDPCLIEEGCLTGYGERDIIRFDTWIENNGDADYFIGEPQANSDQFTFDNCHNHWHYDGYAEYLLFDKTGQEIPIGFKNGFCVIDLGCQNGGSPQYYCNNMGITAGCYDEYWAELECQWIDVTDIPDGEYTFVARVNWDNAPDALGNVETDTINNWAQVCIEIDHSSGQLEFKVIEDCPTYLDCAGVLYGDTQFDCEGNCGGSALQGDLNLDGTQDLLDVQQYAEDLLTGDIPLTSCNDVSGDGTLDVLDISLLADCIVFGNNHLHQATGPHNHCKFGVDITATGEAAELQISDFVAYSHIDISIKNPQSRVVAYQFEITGVSMSSVENLAAGFNGTPMVELVSNQIMAFVTDSTFIERLDDYQPIVRIYYDGHTGDSICINNVTAIINDNVHRVPTTVTGECFLVSNVSAPILPNLMLYPNPASDLINVNWTGSDQIESYEIFDVSGRKILGQSTNKANHLSLDLSNQTAGIYWLRITTRDESQTLKFILQ